MLKSVLTKYLRVYVDCSHEKQRFCEPWSQGGEKIPAAIFGLKPGSETCGDGENECHKMVVREHSWLAKMALAPSVFLILLILLQM